MTEFNTWTERAAAVRARLDAAARAAGRAPDSVRLLPVTKTHPPAAALWAAQAGFAAVGENRVQEAVEKRAAVAAPLRWELIGHLQSNKAKAAARAFDRIQSVDTPKLVRLLGAEAAAAGRPLAVLLQVNAGDDPAKFGCDVADAPALLDAALAQPALRVEGLMAIAPLSPDPDVARRTFARLRELRDALAARGGAALPELSMGMSGDLEAAVAEGSTLVRVGTAIFGGRG